MSDVQINVDFDSMVEPKVLEDGEYKLEIASAEVKNSAQGNTYINLRLTCPDILEAEEIYHIVMLPTGKDPKTDNRFKLQLASLFEACGKQLESSFDPEMFVGEQVWAILKVEEDDTYGKRNRVSRFVKGA